MKINTVHKPPLPQWEMVIVEKKKKKSESFKSSLQLKMHKQAIGFSSEKSVLKDKCYAKDEAAKIQYTVCEEYHQFESKNHY